MNQMITKRSFASRFTDMMNGRSHRKEEPALPATPAQTVGSLIRLFQDTYKLHTDEKNNVQHDGAHVFSGLGIGFANEFRIRAMETFLCDMYNSSDLDTALRRIMAVRKEMLALIDAGVYLSQNAENGIETKEYLKVQAQTVMLSPEETHEFCKLGRAINGVIYRMTGKYYNRLAEAQIESLDMSGLDFTARAQDIIARYGSAENAAIAGLSAKILHDAARKKGHNIALPAADTPWYGSHKRNYWAAP